MKSLILISLLSFMNIGQSAASNIDKDRFCGEVCWMYDIANHDSCKAKCIASPRPNDEEVGACSNCIDDCAGKYVEANPNMVVYEECRRGCFHRFFPQFIGARSQNRRDLENPVPGVPAFLQDYNAYQIYPVTEEICQLTCRAKGADTILSAPGEFEGCVTDCLQRPSSRDRQLQMALDCKNECPTSEEDCMVPCVGTTGSSRNSKLSAEELSAPINGENAASFKSFEQAATVPQLTGSYPSKNLTFHTASAQKLSMTKSPTTPSGKSLKNSALFATVSSSATTTILLNIPKPTASEIAKAPKHIKANAGNGLPYFETTTFWMHAAGSLFVAVAVGLHML